MTVLKLKRGSSLIITLAAANADASAFDWASVTVTGAVRDPRGVLVTDLALELGQTPGMATITVTDTTKWPLGMLKADLFITDGTIQGITETFGIDVRDSVSADLAAPALYNPVSAP
jgi:hypothetical protein